MFSRYFGATVALACLEVYTTSWWMGFFKSLTPKRHVGWSNSWAIALLDVGRLTRHRAKQYGFGFAKSARTYFKDGKPDRVSDLVGVCSFNPHCKKETCSTVGKFHPAHVVLFFFSDPISYPIPFNGSICQGRIHQPLAAN